MTSPKILVALSSFAEYGAAPLERLKESGLPFFVNPSGKRLTEDDIVRFAAECSGIVAGVEPYTAKVLDQLPRLKCISRCGVGTDNIDLIKAKEKGITVVNTPDPVIQPVAELTIGMMLDLLRNITWHTNQLRDKKWAKRGGRNLSGCRVGLIGLGRIGRRVAEILKTFRSQVTAFDPRPDLNWAKDHGVSYISLPELLKESDIVSLHLSSNSKTPLVLGPKEIRAMKKGAILLNLSRGEFVDEEALFSALKDGHLSGAGLDVFRQEPYSGPLCDLDQVLLSPHVATLTRESRVEMETQAVANLLRELA